MYCDNQPDFTWLKPYEEKTFTQYFMPYKKCGCVRNANHECVLGLGVHPGRTNVTVYTTQPFRAARVPARRGQLCRFPGERPSAHDRGGMARGAGRLPQLRRELHALPQPHAPGGRLCRRGRDGHAHAAGTGPLDPQTAFEDEESWADYQGELRATLRTLANHPSFTMLTFGNELACGDLGHLNHDSPDARHDYEGAMAEVRKECAKPVFSFEVGQFEVLPDFDEINDFKGVTRAVNYELIRKKVIAEGLTDTWKRQVEATGELSNLCYREEIEAALRTASFSGISLLGIQDFPGQGTALVGMLNAHLQPKPYPFARPERFSA